MAKKKKEKNQVKSKVSLELKPLKSEDPESIRIYNMTREAIERLNTYLMDFMETIKILIENREEFLKKKDKKKIKETEEGIQFVEKKIVDVTESIKHIAEEMSFLVDVKEED